MKIRLMLIFVMIFLIFVLGCENNKVIINGKQINVEIADNDEEMTKGLMFRRELGENKGMLFIFEDSGSRTFWMKNTLIPLDIIFISEDFKIINIEKAEPCKLEPCKLYHSTDKARYVLEVNKGFTERKKINPGDLVEIKI